MPKAKIGADSKVRPVQSIPSAIQPEKPAASAASLLSSLAGSAKVKATKKKEDERAELPLTDSIRELYSKFAPAKELLDHVTARVESIRAELDPEMFAQYVHVMWTNRNQPANMAVRIREGSKVESEGMYIVQSRYKVQIPDPSNPRDSLVKHLIALGVDAVKSNELVDNEADVAPQLTLRPFNELVNGHYEDKQFVESSDAEKAVGEKLLKLIVENLDEDERALVLQNTPKTVIADGFLQRVCNYANSEEQLKTILRVFVPVTQNKGAKFAVSDTPVDKTKRLVAAASEILGSD